MNKNLPVIGTPRLCIRRFRADDWPDLYEYLSDPEVVRYEPYEVFSTGQSRQEARRRSANRDFWAVCLRETGKVIGNLYLSRQNFETWELGYVLNRRYQRQGYAAEGARALLDRTFSNPVVRKITAMCNTDNTRSWRLLERLGFIREGRLRQNAYFKKDGRNNPVWFDTYIYGLLRTDRGGGAEDTGEDGER